MIQALINKEVNVEVPDKKDLIVRRTKYTSTYDEKGNLTIKKTFKNINVTKLVNETKKTIKTSTAADKLAEIEKVCRQ